MTKVLREEILRRGDIEQFEVETWGELGLLPRNANHVAAAFGHFERTSARTLLYTTDAEGVDINECDSCYLDDLRALRAGNVNIIA